MAPNFTACNKAFAVRSAPDIPLGKPEVVLDARARPRLAPDRGGLHQHRLQALGGAVQSSSQAGWPTAHHHQVENPPGHRPVHQPQLGGQEPGRRFVEHLGRRDDHRQILRRRLQELEQRVALLGLGINPDVRQPQPSGPVAQSQGRGGKLLADDFDAFGGRPVAEPLPPRHERTEDDIGKLGVLCHQTAERRAGHVVQATGRRCAG